MAKSKTRAAKERTWREAIAEQQKTGQAVRAFCRMRRLNESSFYYWRKQIRPCDRKAGGKKDTRPVFAPVVVVDEPVVVVDEPAVAIEIVLTDQTTVRVPPHATPEQLGMVLAVLEPTPC
jgi:hypothetical protein